MLVVIISPKKISVVLATIRERGLLEFQLPSISNQIFNKDEFEVIIIDDFKKDRSKAIYEFAEKSGLDILWMRSKPSVYRSNAPIGCSRNLGLIHATGELIVFIDDYSWIPPEYLASVWAIYAQDRTKSHIGPLITVNFSEPPYLDNFRDYLVKDKDIRSDLATVPVYEGYYGHKTFSKPLYQEHRKSLPKCPGGWFYTANASAPLNLLIEANGFWELADLTREEDVLMGLMLQKNLGWSFDFVNSPETTLIHMSHDYTEDPPPERYKPVSYEDLGWVSRKERDIDVQGGGGHGSNGLDTPADCTQLVTMDIFNTKYPGSWGLIELFNKRTDFRFNEDIEFNLQEERAKMGL